LLVSADDQDAGLLALVENLQRRDLDYIEQAQGLARLMQQYHLTQEQAARRVGKSQSAIANKLRLLKLSEPVLALLRASGLSERHARALLRIEDEAAQLRLVRLIAENGWTVAKTERYIDELCAKSSQKAKLGHFVLRDMRVFFNTINHQLDLIRAAGVDAGTEQRETEHEIVLTIRIPKSACVR
ncbi:MAG: ParB/RepB/Spo0J family partition protein, partial [Oscillospiraceae bacterium]